jgi:hypothetical protein
MLMFARFFKKLKPKAIFRAAAWDASGHGKRLKYWNPSDISICKGVF